MSDGKLTLLLATTLFLVSAPQPDSRTIAEMTANFIVPTDERALQAAELAQPLAASETRVTQAGVDVADREDNAKAQEQQPAPANALSLK